MQNTTPPLPIAITTLELTNFRLFSQLTVELHPKLTVFVAPNAGGKTSIIDALFYHLYLFARPQQLHENIVKDIKKPSKTVISMFEIQTIFKIDIKNNESEQNSNAIDHLIFYKEMPNAYWVSNISDNNFSHSKNKIYGLTNSDKETIIKLLFA